ncbi:MAG: hypothetical protein F6K36_31000 [Symploca sp. SIO3C6]|nr:hypothetical protein [Symploca sp. SIO3C6]
MLQQHVFFHGFGVGGHVNGAIALHLKRGHVFHLKAQIVVNLLPNAVNLGIEGGDFRLQPHGLSPQASDHGLKFVIGFGQVGFQGGDRASRLTNLVEQILEVGEEGINIDLGDRRH